MLVWLNSKARDYTRRERRCRFPPKQGGIQKLITHGIPCRQHSVVFITESQSDGKRMYYKCLVSIPYGILKGFTALRPSLCDSQKTK